MPQLQHAQVARRIGQVDAALFLLVWSALAGFLASRPVGALPAIILGVVPLSLLVGWRGASHAKRLLEGSATLKRSILEGAAIAATLTLALFLWGWLAPDALAAGHPLDGLAPTQLEFWLSFAKFIAAPIGVAAVIGAAHGSALHLLNRWLVARWVRDA